MLKKGILGLVLGIIIGAGATLAVPAYAAVKQYVLTEYMQPVIVNGKQYADKDLPILNYQGKTYLPLAKVGDLLGTPYRYNNELKRVEIGAVPPTYEEVTVVEHDINPAKPGSSATDGPAGRKNDTLRPDTEIVEIEEPGYMGYPDSADPSYQWAEVVGSDELPPLMSEGWISTAMLREIHNIRFNPGDEAYHMNFLTGALWKERILGTVTITKEIDDTRDGVFTVEGIRIKKYDGSYFFNIDDLRGKGIIQ